jgi:hypothetical protein
LPGRPDASDDRLVLFSGECGDSHELPPDGDADQHGGRVDILRRATMPHTGLLAGPISGLRYETPTHRGLTGEHGEFRYEPGERVAFLVGATPIGNVSVRPRVDLAQIVAWVDGDVAKLRDPGLTNVARFVFTLGRRAIRDHGRRSRRRSTPSSVTGASTSGTTPISRAPAPATNFRRSPTTR